MPAPRRVLGSSFPTLDAKTGIIQAMIYSVETYYKETMESYNLCIERPGQICEIPTGYVHKSHAFPHRARVSNEGGEGGA